MTVTDNAVALARAVLAGDAPAVAGLLDEVLAEADLGPGREWLALWDGFARAFLAGISACSTEHRDATPTSRAKHAYNNADAMMAERARRLAARTKE